MSQPRLTINYCQGLSLKVRRNLVLMVGAGMSLFHLYTSGVGLCPTPVQRSIHLALTLVLVFFLYPAGQKSLSLAYDGLLALLGAVGCGYIAIFHEDIAFRGGRPLGYELILGFMTMVLALEAGRRVLGKILPILAIVFLLYCYFGQYAPWFFQHRGVSLNRLIQHMYLTHEGLFGVAIGVSSTYIFMFVLFGAFLSHGGGIRLFNNLALALTGKVSGGPAKVSVVASGLMGTINGSSVANVATTGAVTIPLMKEAGFQPEEAGAIEACASTGGQLMPPIMGAGAFIMSEFLGVPYLTIVIAALIPSILYFLSIFIAVHFMAKKRGLGGVAGTLTVKEILLADGHLAIPIFVMLGLLLSRYTPLKAAFYGIIALGLVGSLKSQTRLNPKALVVTLAEGAKGGAFTASACAVVGFLVGTFSLTGLGLSLSAHIIELTKGMMGPTLFVSMLACLVLGMGLPTTANYIVTSTVIAPALAKLGVIPLAAHLFIFYFGILADITPPVCLASITAAGLAHGNAHKTGVKAFILATPAFILPYLFIYSPEILLLKGTVLEVTALTAAIVAGLVALGAAFNGYLAGPLGLGGRFLLLIAGGALFVPTPKIRLLGLAIFSLIIVGRIVKKRKSDPLNSEGL